MGGILVILFSYFFFMQIKTSFHKDSYLVVSRTRIEESQKHRSAPNSWLTESFVYIYIGIITACLILSAIRSKVFFNVCMAASQNLHDTMFHRLIQTTMRFFDVNPCGNIMNRFTNDLLKVDDVLPRVLFAALQVNLRMLGVIIVIIYTDIKLSIVFFAMSGLFILIRHIYLKSSINVQRFDGISM